ncbi:MAG: putative DNA binding domain-containing protein [Anaerolineales bacterium]
MSKQIDTEQVKSLLLQEESSILEFKRQQYLIDDKDETVKKGQRDELIKDILSLANGNSITAGDTAYLIIGAENTKNNDGIREIQNVEHILNTRRILDIINPSCSPKLEELDAYAVELEGKQLNLIVINPSPHLYETTRKLNPTTAKDPFTEYTVFVRHNESIRVASGRERDAIAKLKKVRFNEANNPSPEPFGAVVGATIGGLSFGAAAEKILGKKEGARTAGTIAGALFGGSIGFMFGNTFKNMVEIRRGWNRSTPEQNFIAVVISGFTMLISITVMRYFSRKNKRNALAKE